MPKNVYAWLENLIDDFCYQPLDNMTRQIITQAIVEGLPANFPGNYTVSIEWNRDGTIPQVGMNFVDENEHLLFMLKYS